MKRIAVFCVTFHSDVELEHYKASLQRAVEAAKGEVASKTFTKSSGNDDDDLIQN